LARSGIMQSIQQKDPRKSASISQTWGSKPSDRVLSSWKEIAAFFGKGVRTVQRWERELSLPVRRPNGDKQIVFAKVQELETWLGQHAARGNRDVEPDRRDSDLQILQQMETMSLDDVIRIKELAERIQELAERAARTNRKAS
jgi:hypothetical protein